MNRLDRANLIISPEKTKNDKIVLKYLETHMDKIVRFMYVKIIRFGKKNYDKLKSLGVKMTPTLLYQGRTIQGASNIIDVWKSERAPTTNTSVPSSSDIRELWRSEMLSKDQEGEADRLNDGFDIDEAQSKMEEMRKRLAIPNRKFKKSESRKFENMPLSEMNNIYQEPDNGDELIANFLEGEIMPN